jgi:phosphatidylglycerol:prolipoprotein diacylglycerol transferase
VALALLVGIFQLTDSFKRNGLPAELAEKYVLTAGFLGLVGARFWYIAESYEYVKEDLLAAILSTSGFTFYGGFIVASIALYLMCQRDKLSKLAFIDALGPALALGYAIGRLGCQLSGDGDYGMATDSWLGMSYSSGVIPTPENVKVFPTPLYESAISILIYFILRKIELKNWTPDGSRFALYLLLMASERFIVEFLRVNQRIVYGLSEAQLIAIALFAIGGFLFFNARRNSQIRA